MHTLPDLPYEYDQLQLYLSVTTLKTHHQKHHKGYVNKLNTALEGHSKLAKLSVEELLKNIETVPKDIRTAVVHNAGQHFNHSLYWTSITHKQTSFSEPFKEACMKEFDSMADMLKEIMKKSLSVFGSGWTWISLDGDKIIIENTLNHDNPLLHGRIPLGVIDVWEHAYYLDFKNERNKYIENIIQILDWTSISERYEAALKA